jgi:hypothetical protein
MNAPRVGRPTSPTHGLARLVTHEVDHLYGVLYRSRMRPGSRPIPVADYKGTGHKWRYEGAALGHRG